MSHPEAIMQGNVLTVEIRCRDGDLAFDAITEVTRRAVLGDDESAWSMATVTPLNDDSTHRLLTVSCRQLRSVAEWKLLLDGPIRSVARATTSWETALVGDHVGTTQIHG